MQLNDHINRFVDNGLESEEVASPMDPPSAYKPTIKEKIALAAMPVFLKGLMEEHVYFLEQLTKFDEALITFKKMNFQFDEATSAVFREFFLMYDYNMIAHHMKEEKILFPLLAERLIASGEHSPIDDAVNPIDVMEDEHIKMGQTSCLVFNLLGLGARLPDARSRAMIFEHAVSQGQDLVERLKLHIFREDEVVFQLACQHLSADELAAMELKAKKTVSA